MMLTTTMAMTVRSKRREDVSPNMPATLPICIRHDPFEGQSALPPSLIIMHHCDRRCVFVYSSNKIKTTFALQEEADICKIGE